MPVLAAYIGAHDVSGLIYKSSNECSYWSFPFVYSPELYSSFTTETAFYQSLFEQMCKEQSLKLADCDIILTGFLEPPKLDLPLKMYVSLEKVMNKFDHYYPVLINNYAIITKEQIFSQKPLVSKNKEFFNLNSLDFHANLTIYPQVVASDLVSRIEMDTLLLDTADEGRINIPETTPVIYFGSRFNKLHGINELNTLFILQTLKNPGVYEIFIDSSNSALLSNLLKIYTGKENTVGYHPEKLGTVIVSDNTIECMISSQIGTSQIIDLEKEKIFILPMTVEERTRILLKVTGSPQKEKIVTGGSLGLIFDTRHSKSNFAADFKQYNSSLKTMGQQIGK